MTTYDKICRVCSSPANYDVFAKIPTYLHANSHEFLNWQKCINVLLEETTGLKVSRDDGLPESICALCISYLKHAATFRAQAICNALTLKAVQILQPQPTTSKINKQSEELADKENLLITAEDLTYAENRELDTNLLTNNCQQVQNKVRKQLLNNNFHANLPTQQYVEQQMRYLNLLFGKDTKSHVRGKRRGQAEAGAHYNITPLDNGGDVEEDLQSTSTTSSDENDIENAHADGENKSKYNIFSYKEKNFEEDDIMDLDELRQAITISKPESCKERKCRACARRFMFEDSYMEHMDTCIEYKLLTYIEEINRLLEIRRTKAISPHEFIRRMIFCLRKTCEWLKINCNDMLLPDLNSNGDDNVINSDVGNGDDNGMNSDIGNSDQQKSNNFNQNEVTENNILATPKATATNKTFTKKHELLHKSRIRSLFVNPKPLKSGALTPITAGNNVLYEIERSLSRSSNQQQQSDLELDLSLDSRQLKKPIAVLATTGTTSTTANRNCNIANNNLNHKAACHNSTRNDVDRWTFLQKLQKAGYQTPPSNKVAFPTTTTTPTPSTPRISVRKDLLPPATATDMAPLLQEVPQTPTISARCDPCHILFANVASLEFHNALCHNKMSANSQQRVSVGEDAAAALSDAEEQRKRIIALFEDDDNDDV